MKKVDIDRIFVKLSLKVRSTGHNYGGLTVSLDILKHKGFV